MARLTYVALGLALASLVSGFFIRSTAVPLFASIGLSALVLILILRGWARRLRQTGGLGEEREELEELEEFEVFEVPDEEVDAGEIVVVEAEEARAQRATRRRAVTELLEERPRRERPERPARPSVVRTPRPAGAPRRVVVLPGRSRYHAPGCRFARGKGAEEISEATARRKHFTTCSVCLGR